MRAWLARRASKGARGNVQERPSVCAQAYMILRSPTDFNAKLGAGSRKARQAADKFAAHASLWRGAERALREADPAFADAFTALAVTYGFQGSPHIDKQNVGPFYALALGDFDEGTGGVAVEADARTVCVVDTKNRLGKVDGRFPHWVTPWDARGGKERFSLIYYRTAGRAPSPSRAPPSTSTGGACTSTRRGRRRRTSRGRNGGSSILSVEGGQTVRIAASCSPVCPRLYVRLYVPRIVLRIVPRIVPRIVGEILARCVTCFAGSSHLHSTMRAAWRTSRRGHASAARCVDASPKDAKRAAAAARRVGADAKIIAAELEARRASAASASASSASPSPRARCGT